MHDQAMKNWMDFMTEGRGFHRTAAGAVKRPAVFTPGIVQNLCAMAIEKYFMAVFMLHGKLPANHTMQDMLVEGRALLGIPEELERKLLRMDELQQICSIEHFKIIEPGLEEVGDFLEALKAVGAIAEQEVLNAEGPGS
jgi:hypothetical protein